jgi:16S rRNA processing protein RimM
VFSYTDPRENIINYRRWHLDKQGVSGEWRLAEGRRHGKGVVARLEGCEDRDAATALVDSDIFVERAQLPPLDEGEYYWADLQGMQVVNRQGERLGRVDSLFETGANDVLVVKGDRERLIPFVSGRVILSVDRSSGEILVDWDKDF